MHLLGAVITYVVKSDATRGRQRGGEEEASVAKVRYRYCRVNNVMISLLQWNEIFVGSFVVLARNLNQSIEGGSLF